LAFTLRRSTSPNSRKPNPALLAPAFFSKLQIRSAPEPATSRGLEVRSLASDRKKAATWNRSTWPLLHDLLPTTLPNDDYGRKLNSSCVVVSPLAGAYFQFFRVSSTALTRIGCPPMTFFSLIRPSAPITTCTFTTPVSRSLLATSGYVGAGLDSALRPSCACKFAAPRPSVIASNAPPRILPLRPFLIRHVPLELAFRNFLNALDLPC